MTCVCLLCSSVTDNHESLFIELRQKEDDVMLLQDEVQQLTETINFINAQHSQKIRKLTLHKLIKAKSNLSFDSQMLLEKII